MPELGHSVHVDVRGLELGPRVLLPLPDGRGREPDRADQDGARVARPRAAASRSRSRPARSGTTASTRRTGTWPRRTSSSSSTSATTSTSTASAPAASGTPTVPDVVRGGVLHARALPAAALALQDGPGPPGGAPAVPVDGHLGRPRGRQRLLGHLSGVRRTRAPSSSQRRAAAYQAYFENMPVPLSAQPEAGTSVQLYRRLQLRRHRGVQPARHAPVPHRQPVRRRRAAALRRRLRPGRDDDRRRRRRRGCSTGLERSSARWNVIAQGVLMGQLKHDADGGRFWNDSWDGWPGQRAADPSAHRRRRGAGTRS